MDFLNNTLKIYKKELLMNNLFISLTYEEHEKYVIINLCFGG